MDVLLLEASAVAVLVASPRLFAGPRRPPPSDLALFAVRLLLVKLVAVIRLGQAGQRRSDLGRRHGDALSLRDPAASDLDRLVGAPAA